MTLIVCGGLSGAQAATQTRSAVTATIATTADIWVTVTGTVTGAPGAVVRVTLQWGNAGPGPATGGVRVSYTPPFGTSIAAVPPGWTRSGTSIVRIAPGTLASGGTRSVGISMKVDATAKAGSLLVGGTAQADPIAVMDPAQGNNAAASRVQVSGTPSPTPSKSPSTSPSPTRSPSKSPTPTRTPTPTKSPTTKPTTKPTPKPTLKVTPSKVAVQGRPSPVTGPTKVSSRATPTPAVAPSATAPATAPTGAPGTGAGGLSAPADPSVSQGSTGDQVVADPTSPTPPSSGSAVQVLPLIGSLACFTAAGVGAVMLNRRRGGEALGSRGSSRPF